MFLVKGLEKKCAILASEVKKVIFYFLCIILKLLAEYDSYKMSTQ